MSTWQYKTMHKGVRDKNKPLKQFDTKIKYKNDKETEKNYHSHSTELKDSKIIFVPN